MSHEQNGTAKEAAVTNEDESRLLLQKQGYCPYGHYPWDYWEKRALAAGVPKELAALGRAVMREAHQHAWSELLQRACGWKDNGEGMIALARQAPERASFVWQELLEIRPELVRGAGRTGLGRAEHGQPSDWLFVSARGKPLNKNVLSELITHYAKKAKVKKHITCHSWRHTCATHLLKNRANLRHVQEILGHRSLATTERYLHLTISDLKEAHRRFHPREKGME